MTHVTHWNNSGYYLTMEAVFLIAMYVPVDVETEIVRTVGITRE